MAYFIFLKSLRSLEEFRKNPHVKIPPKSPCANFQSLCIFKNSNFIRKIIFPPIPAHPAQPRAAPAHFTPQAAVRALGPLGPLGLSSFDVFAKRHLFFEFAQSVNGVSSLSSVPSGPHPSDPPPSSRRPTQIMSPLRLTIIDRPAPPSLHH
jgi:hypothetical protein